jgi:MFS family permease
MVLVYKLEAKGKIIQYLASGSALIGISFLVLIVDRSLFIIIAGMVIITLGEMLLFPFINNFWVSRTNQYNRGRYAALFAMTFSLAQVLAPIISSQIATSAGFNALWLTNFLLCAIASTSFFFFLKRNGYEL